MGTTVVGTVRRDLAAGYPFADKADKVTRLAPVPNPPVTASEGRARRITLNAFFLFSSEILARFFTLFTVSFMTHHWVPDYYGQYCIALNWVNIFSAVSSLGLGSLAIRDVAHDKKLTSFYFRNMFFLRAAISLLFVAVLAFLGSWLGYEPVLRLALVVLGLRLLIDVPSLTYATLLQAHELMGFQGLVSLVGASLRMLGIGLVIYFGLGMVEACWVWVAVGLLCLALFWRIGRKMGWKANWELFRWGKPGKS